MRTASPVLAALLALPGCQLLASTDVQADVPQQFDLTKEVLTQAQTLILNPGVGHWEIDFQKRLVTGDLRGADGGAYRIVFNDGILWLHSRADGPTATQMPSIYADRFGQVFDALRGGMVGLTFVSGSPADLSSEWFPPGVSSKPPSHYRVVTPWTWDDEYAVYVDVYDTSEGGKVGRLNVWHIQRAEPLKLLGVELRDIPIGLARSIRDVPLDPENTGNVVPDDWDYLFPSTRHVYTASNWQNPPYHDSIRRAWLQPVLPVPSQASGMYEETHLCTAAGETTYSWEQTWKVNPADVGRIDAARSECDTITFSAGLKASVLTHTGQHACVDGTWAVVNLATTPPTVLNSESVSVCAGDASDPSGELRPYVMQQDMPANADLANLGVRWSGTYRFTCSGAHTPTVDDQIGSTRTIFSVAGMLPDPTQPGTPLISWDCWPGWTVPPQ